MTELPNAQKRLEDCEIHLKQSYGANLERVKHLKGTSNMEEVLYFRLHLLQAICAYTSGYIGKAEKLLKKAEKEFKSLQVPDEALEEVKAQGYSEKEARLALRATAFQPSMAVRHILEDRQKKADIWKVEKEKQRRQRKYGKTNDGSWVDLKYLDNLTNILGM